jgi:hypothetical protein
VTRLRITDLHAHHSTDQEHLRHGLTEERRARRAEVTVVLPVADLSNLLNGAVDGDIGAGELTPGIAQ